MRTVRRYELGSVPNLQVMMPLGARILSLVDEPTGPVMFALVNLAVAEAPRNFRIFATGEEFDERKIRCDYIGSCAAGHVVEVFG